MTLDINDFKPLLGLEVTDTSKDSVLTFILANVTEVICNYCHITEVPKGLECTAYRMAMDLYRNEGIGEADSEDGTITGKANWYANPGKEEIVEPEPQGARSTERFNTVSACPEWAQPTIRKMVEKGLLAGKGLWMLTGYQSTLICLWTCLDFL